MTNKNMTFNTEFNINFYYVKNKKIFKFIVNYINIAWIYKLIKYYNYKIPSNTVNFN